MKPIILLGRKSAGTKNDITLLRQSLDGALAGREIVTIFFEDLVFDISNPAQRIYDSVSSRDLADSALVVAFNWYSSRPPLYLRDMAFAAALYLHARDVPFWNQEMKLQRSTTKLSAMMQLALAGIPVPATVYASQRTVLVGAVKHVPLPLIVKTIAGSRGAHNHLVHTHQDLAALVEAADPLVPFMVQEFIKNDGDVRFVCFGAEPAMAIRRTRSSQDTHLNNTSAGASAHLADVAEFDATLVSAVSQICVMMGRDMAGVDIVQSNDGTGRWVCLEVNAIPQLTSGSFTDEKAQRMVMALNKFTKGTA